MEEVLGSLQMKYENREAISTFDASSLALQNMLPHKTFDSTVLPIFPVAMSFNCLLR
jgi:hypothetical protein